MRWTESCLVVFALFLSQCQSEKAPNEPKESPLEPPEPMTVRLEDERPLLLTYLDPETGRYATTESVQDIPDSAQNAVVVIDLSLSPQARQSSRYVQVADFTQPRPDGTVPVSVASRYGFERQIAPGGETSISSDGVVLYSAQWCGVCKKAKRILTEWKVAFEEKDIEASKSAMKELAQKAAAAGISPGGVPVIDVAGTLLQGLDEERLRSSLQSAGLWPSQDG